PGGTHAGHDPALGFNGTQGKLLIVGDSWCWRCAAYHTLHRPRRLHGTPVDRSLTADTEGLGIAPANTAHLYLPVEQSHHGGGLDSAGTAVDDQVHLLAQPLAD